MLLISLYNVWRPEQSTGQMLQQQFLQSSCGGSGKEKERERERERERKNCFANLLQQSLDQHDFEENAESLRK